MPRRLPRVAPGATAGLAALAAVAALAAAAPAVAAPAGDLAARDRALGRAEARLAARLAEERAALAATRTRIEALRARHATHLALVRARLRALYAGGGADPVIAVLAGETGEAETRAALARAVARSDEALMARYRASVTELRAAEAALVHRKRALAADERALAARRAAVRARLRAERAAARAPADAGAARLPGSAESSEAGAVDGRGLPRAIREGRLLPGAPPQDARTGLPILFDRPAPGPPVAVAVPGRGVVAVPAPGVPARGPRRFMAMTAIRAGGGGPSASGLPFDARALAAAHRTLPLGALLRLRRGSAEVVVRVVDRGPYAANRDLEIGPAAAAALGMARSGPVRVEVLG